MKNKVIELLQSKIGENRVLGMQLSLGALGWSVDDFAKKCIIDNWLYRYGKDDDANHYWNIGNYSVNVSTKIDRWDKTKSIGIYFAGLEGTLKKKFPVNESMLHAYKCVYMCLVIEKNI